RVRHVIADAYPTDILQRDFGGHVEDQRVRPPPPVEPILACNARVRRIFQPDYLAASAKKQIADEIVRVVIDDIVACTDGDDHTFYGTVDCGCQPRSWHPPPQTVKTRREAVVQKRGSQTTFISQDAHCIELAIRAP